MITATTLITRVFNFFLGAAQVIVCVTFTFLFNVGFYVILYQTYRYLRYGTWPEISLMYLVEYGPSWLISWLDKPTGWFGLHALVVAGLSAVPLSMFLIAIGGIGAIVLRIEGASCFSAVAGRRSQD